VNWGLTSDDSIANGMFTNDATNTTAMTYTMGNIPGSDTSTGASDRTNASALFGLLAGRVTSYSGFVYVDQNQQFTTGAALDEKYGQREFGFYVSDNWRLFPTLTVNYGLRWEYQGAPYDRANIYSSLVNGEADVWGQSGVGNVFAPGTLTGVVPVYQLNNGKSWYEAEYNNYAPSIGLAWTPGLDNRWYNMLFGGPSKTVFRAGYAITYTREGTGNWLSMVEGNPGYFGDQFSDAAAADGPGTFAAGTVLLQSLNINNGSGNAVAQTPATFGGTFTIDPLASQSVNAFATNLSTPMVQSWSFGIQREFNPDTVFEVRYVGNHGTGLWRQLNLNEINIFENGFLTEFNNARTNLAICQANATACITAQTNAGVAASQRTSSSYGNWGLTGQMALPIMTAAFTGTANTLPSTTQANANFRSSARVSNLTLGVAGTFANVLATTLSFWCNMSGLNATGGSTSGYCVGQTAAGNLGGFYPINFFRVNPEARGGTFLMYNGTHSTYNSLVLELRRRMSKGLYANVNYVWSKSLTNAYADSSTSFSGLDTLRDNGRSKGPSPFDLRHALKLNLIWEMPFGPGRKWSSGNGVVNRIIEGWEVSSISRLQSGRTSQLTGGQGGTFNSNDGGVIFTGINQQQLQSMLDIRAPEGTGQVFYFPASLLDANQQRANSAFLLACNTPGQWCQRTFIQGPGFFRADISLLKRTRITETTNVEFRAEFLNAFNNINFLYGGSAATTANSVSLQSTTFGRIVSPNAYQDSSTTDDPGGRVVQLVLRINF
jgi:hypothetical protein